ncbi:MAG: hypothetical protein AAF585_19375 [Verrucomicrobiota bacterium]
MRALLIPFLFVSCAFAEEVINPYPRQVLDRQLPVSWEFDDSADGWELQNHLETSDDCGFADAN